MKILISFQPVDGEGMGVELDATEVAELIEKHLEAIPLIRDDRGRVYLACIEAEPWRE